MRSRKRCEKLLAGLPYFAGLDDHALGGVAERATERSFQPDEVIFLEGDETQGLWVVEDGTVKITKLTPEGDEYILHLRGPGDSFNDVGALDGGGTAANAIALSMVTAWTLAPSCLDEVLLQYPEVARASLRMLAGRVRVLNRQLEEVTLYPAIARLARFLLSQAEDPNLSGPGITRSAIAAHLATTPETVSRALAKIQDAGAIRFDRHRILIVQEELLRSIANL